MLPLFTLLMRLRIASKDPAYRPISRQVMLVCIKPLLTLHSFLTILDLLLYIQTQVSVLADANERLGSGVSVHS